MLAKTKIFTQLTKNSKIAYKKPSLKVNSSRRFYRSSSALYFNQDPLPYAKTALAPYISEETLEYHYGKHHATYVNKLNELTKGTELESKTLTEIVKTQKGPIFNNAAQAWNHTFYWNSLSPNGGGEPTGKMKELIEKNFGSFSEFKTKFNQEAVTHFGSGWAWLVLEPTSGSLKVVSTHDAGNPILDGYVPLLTCDVWEHAYYIDYRNARPKYLDNWWSLVNWEFAEKNLSAKH